MPALIIDNYDSFTFNLVHAVAAITGEMPIVLRNDEMDWEEIRGLGFTSVIISPGPGRPDRARDFGVSRDAILSATVPVLGVCLGHQGIASLFGGQVAQVSPVHGQSSEIIHDGDPLFRGIPERFSAVRYHSLAVMEPLPAELRKIAWSSDGTVMALRHVTRPLWGVQFHPESVASEYGVELLRNFLSPRSRPGLCRRERPANQSIKTQASARGKARRIPLRHPPEVLFRELFSNERYAFWLDSALVTERSRFSYMGASNEVVNTNGFEQVDQLLQDRSDVPDLPFAFTGGYVGYFGYECGSRHRHQSPLPDSVLLRVESFLAIDHFESTLYLLGPEQWLDDMERRIGTLTAPLAAPRWNRGRPIEHYSISR